MAKFQPAVYGYCRASTHRQTESPEGQKVLIREHCKLHGLAEPIFFVDVATSAKVPLRDRAAGKDLCRRLQRGDVVVITKLDRAFRRIADCCAVLEDWEKQGVGLHICNMAGGSIDLSSPIGRMVIHFLAAFAEFERQICKERIREAMGVKREKGEKISSHAPLGFKFETKYRQVAGKTTKVVVIVPDPVEREVMRSIAAWHDDPDHPMYWAEIAAHLLKLNIRTRRGDLWYTPRITKAYKAEKKLQQLEAEAARPGPDAKWGDE